MDEQKENQKIGNKAYDSSELYQTLVENSVDIIFIEDKNCNFLFVNSAFCDLLGFSKDEISNLNSCELIHPDDLEMFQMTMRLIIDGESYKKLEYRFQTKSKDYVILSTNVIPFLDNNSNVIGIIGTARDITARKKAQFELESRAYQQAMVAEFGQIALVEKNLNHLFKKAVNLLSKTLDVELAKILEYYPEEGFLKLVAGVGWSDGLVGNATVDANENSQAGFTLLKTAPVIVEDLRQETRFKGPPLLTNHQVISGMSVIIQGKNKPYGILGVHSTKKMKFSKDDINFLLAIANILANAIVQKNSELEIRKSEENYKKAFEISQKTLREKDILLKEIHHRVKNNLQIISSLIILEEKYIEDPSVIQLFKDFQNRIKSMALIHEILYQSENFEFINISKYLENLTRVIFHTYQSESKKVILDLNIDNIDLDLTKAINCGLIINELVTNSLKYAFSSKTEGKVFINIKENMDGLITMEIGDNGSGKISNAQFEKPSSLGLKLVKTITKQIEGELEFNSSNGIKFIIKFKK